MKTLLINTISNLILAIGLGVVIFQIFDPWSIYIGIVCVGSSIGLRELLAKNSNSLITKISFLDSIKPFEPCKKEFIKMVYGALLLLVGALGAYLLNEYNYLSIAIILLLVIWLPGSYLIMRYMLCITEYSKIIK